MIGGGFTGASVALDLIRDHGFAGQISIFEPRATLGSGLAYDTREPAHRTNVPAARMSALPDQREHFAEWIEANGLIGDDPQARAPDGQIYPQRGLFGRYMSELMAPVLKSGVVRHVRERVQTVSRQPDGWHLVGEDGTVVVADLLVLAATHPSPVAPPPIEQVLRGDARYIPDSTTPHALDAIQPQDRVLIIGTGLTAADVIAALRLRGHQAEITAFSRRGLLSRGHAATRLPPFGDFVSAPSRTALSLLQRVRAAVRQAASEAVTWHSVFDALRAQGAQIWKALPVAEKRRLLRHLRRYWEIHRYRVAPQMEALLDECLDCGALAVVAGTIGRIDTTGDRIGVEFRRRRSNVVDYQAFDRVVITTGPAHGSYLNSQQWLSGLKQAGTLMPDSFSLGIACDETGQAIGSIGQPVAGLFIAGPLGRGTFGELIGVPEVALNARLIAGEIAKQVQLRWASPVPNS
jgi:uncharacterized NAD(P)/FAD-binding protein YdhS